MKVIKFIACFATFLVANLVSPVSTAQTLSTLAATPTEPSLAYAVLPADSVIKISRDMLVNPAPPPGSGSSIIDLLHSKDQDVASRGEAIHWEHTAGFADGMHNSKSAANADTYRNKIQTLLAARSTQLATQAKAAGKVFRDKAAAAKDTTTMASGVIMTTLKAGTGPKPTADDQVKVHYEGKLIDGTVFDSSIQRGQPVTFKVTGVVPCWTEALQHMNVGSKIKLVCPPDLAYGDRGSPPKIPGGSTLVFDVELLDVIKAPPVAAEPATPAVPAAAVPATPAPAAPAAPAATAPPK